jgi:hypothetical protein
VCTPVLPVHCDISQLPADFPLPVFAIPTIYPTLLIEAYLTIYIVYMMYNEKLENKFECVLETI